MESDISSENYYDEPIYTDGDKIVEFPGGTNERVTHCELLMDYPISAIKKIKRRSCGNPSDSRERWLFS